MIEKIQITITPGLSEERVKIVHRAVACTSDDSLRRFRNLGWIGISDEDLVVVSTKRHQLLNNPPPVLGRKGF